MSTTSTAGRRCGSGLVPAEGWRLSVFAAGAAASHFGLTGVATVPPQTVRLAEGRSGGLSGICDVTQQVRQVVQIARRECPHRKRSRDRRTRLGRGAADS